MQKVTVTLNDDQIAELDRFMNERGYTNRPEAIYHLACAGIQQHTATSAIRAIVSRPLSMSMTEP